MEITFRICFPTIQDAYDYYSEGIDEFDYRRLRTAFSLWIKEKFNIENEIQLIPCGFPEWIFNFLESYEDALHFFKIMNLAVKADLTAYISYKSFDFGYGYWSGYTFWDADVVYVSRGCVKFPTDSTRKLYLNWLSLVLSHELIHYFTKLNKEVDNNLKLDKTEEFYGFIVQKYPLGED